MVTHRWPVRAELEKMDTLQLGALANALGVGRWIMDEPRAMIISYLWSKIVARTNEEA